jgi:hypothetical protein
MLGSLRGGRIESTHRRRISATGRCSRDHHSTAARNRRFPSFAANRCVAADHTRRSDQKVGRAVRDARSCPAPSHVRTLGGSSLLHDPDIELRGSHKTWLVGALHLVCPRCGATGGRSRPHPHQDWSRDRTNGSRSERWPSGRRRRNGRPFLDSSTEGLGQCSPALFSRAAFPHSGRCSSLVRGARAFLRGSRSAPHRGGPRSAMVRLVRAALVAEMDGQAGSTDLSRLWVNFALLGTLRHRNILTQ